MYDSMRKMTSGLNNENTILNVAKILGVEKMDDFPHYSTINNYLERLDPNELEAIVQKLTMRLINIQVFKNQRFKNKYWQIIVDGTKLFDTDEAHSEGALFKVHKDKDKNITSVEYYYYVLEAKIFVNKQLVLSICTVFCKNDEGVSPYEEAEESQEKKKQDCEIKAFYRMAKELEKLFGKGGICLTADSLYACAPVFEICRKNNWRYIIRFKEGSIKTIAEEFERASEEFNKTALYRPHKYVEFTVVGDGKYGYLNTILYKGHYINMIRYREETNEKTDKKKYPFLFITNLPINRNNCAGLVVGGRNRWSIENQGFNTQKNHGYDLTHKFSLNYNAIQCHYYLTQIAHAISQIFENQNAILIELKMANYDVHEHIIDDFKFKKINVHVVVSKTDSA